MPEKDVVEQATAFIKAQMTAEAEGKQAFVCPLCGGTAKWTREERSGHLHCNCGTCGFKVME